LLFADVADDGGCVGLDLGDEFILAGLAVGGFAGDARRSVVAAANRHQSQCGR
jgi:hypothetical protein